MPEIPQGYEYVLFDICSDGLYYRRHFAMSAKGELWELWYGHCGHPKVSKPPLDAPILCKRPPFLVFFLSRGP